MDYNIKTIDTFGRDIMDIVLENRNLTEEEMERLLNPSVSDVEFPFQIPNIAEGINLLSKALENEANIGIIQDSDVDGMTSSALLYLFLVNECQYDKDKITIFYHETKAHGLDDEKVLKQVKKSDVDLLIIPDAGTNDLKQIKELLSMGKKVLTLDHHNQSNPNDKTILKDQNGNIIYVLINNQLGTYSKVLSGVGVVYKFLVAIMENELVHYMDLVAVGNVADSMDINEPELRYIVNKGLENINNQFFKELLDKDYYTPTDVSFNIANKLNAVCRYGKMEEKIDTFKALALFEEERVYKPRTTKKNPNPKEEIQSLQKFMARVVGNVKTRQDNAVKSSLPKIDEYIKKNNCEEHKVILIVNEGKGKESLLAQNVGGLVANKLADKYRRPIMIIHKHDDEYSGSMRGYGVESFKDILESTGIVSVKGHDNSAGVFVKKSDMPRLQKRLDRAMETVNLTIEMGYQVECEIDVDDLTPSTFKKFEEMKKVWFSFCEEPLFLIRGVELSRSDIKQPFTTLITFNHQGYKFDKNFASGDFVSRITHSEYKGFGKPKLSCDIIVKLGVNEFNKNGFFEIVDMESEIIGVDKGERKKNCPF